jgi:hypothetical protein
MSKFTFICEDEPMPFSDGIVSKKTVEFNGESLNDIISEFEMFLRGCGFHFNGQLDFVDNHSDNFDYSALPPEWFTEEFKTPQSDPWTKIVQRHEEDLEQQYLNNVFGSSEFICPVCKLSEKTMEGHKCWDANCPIAKCGK